MAVCGIIFDLDGTLLYTLEDLADSADIVLAERGYPIHSLDEYRFFVGNGVRMLIKRALPKECGEDIVEEAYQAFSQEYMKRYLHKTKPYPGILELLGELKKRKIRVGILSNKPNEPTQNLKEHFFGGLSDAALGEREGVARKPDPNGVFELLKCLELKPEETLYVGDSDVDMKTAKNAGLFSIGVLWGFRSKAELLESGAGAVVLEPLEILDYLK